MTDSDSIQVPPVQPSAVAAAPDLPQLDSGTTLDGRYRLLEVAGRGPGWVRWHADDDVLGRRVVVVGFTGGSPDAAVDAARRAAAIDDARLVRVLDAGGGPTSFVVEEALPGATSLAQLVGGEPLPPEEVRRLVGEAAAALAVADARGLHHLALGPTSLWVLEDGSVKVRGLATEAALVGIDEGLPGPAREDAAGLLRLLYAALTAHWPGPPSAPATEGTAPLPRAPEVDGRPVAPSQLSSLVAPEFDELTAHLTAREDADPVRSAGTDNATASLITPAALAARLAPWPPTALVDYTARSRLSDPTSTAAVPAATPSAMPAPAAPTSAATPDSDVAGSGAGPSAGAGDATGSATPAAETPAAETPAATPGAETPAAETPAVAPAAAPGADTPGAAPGADTPGDQSQRSAPQTSGPHAPTVAPTEATAALPPDLPPDPPRDPSSDSRRGPAAPLPGGGPAAYPEPASARLSDVMVETDAPAEPPAPMVSEQAAAAGPPDSRLALGLVAAFVLVFALLGAWGLPRLSGVDLGTTPAKRATASSATSSSSGPPATLSLVAILQGATFDPDGDNQGTSRTVAAAWDGNPSTSWRSGWYASEDFGGLKRRGYGIIADLGQVTPVRRVVVTLPAAQDVTVYVANQASLTGATAIGTSTGKAGQVVFDVPGGTPVNGQLVIVFVTKLGPDGGGRFRAQVSELQVAK